MRRVIILLNNGFEEIEALAPLDVLRRLNYEVLLVSMIDTLEARGYISKAHGAKPRKVNLTQEALNNMRF